MFADELANAQMLTSTGRFEEARSMCRVLLRDYPSSADAHTAMGDTFATEGRWPDAVKWYELALELDFDPAVMEKLASARGHAIRSGTGTSAGPHIAIPRPAAAPEEENRGRRHQTLAMVAVGVILITAIAFLIFRPGKSRSESVTGSAGDQPAAAGALAQGPVGAYGLQSGPTTPGQPAAGPAASGTDAPPTGADAATRYTGHPTASSGPAKAPRGTQQDVPVAELYSRIEQHVLGQMKLSKFSEGTSVSPNVSLALDDYAGAGIMTLRAPRTTDADKLERDVLGSAFRATAAAMRADSSLRDMVVRCVVRLPNQQGDDENVVVFRCRASRESMGQWVSANQMPTIEQLRQGILGQVWWDREALLRYIEARKGAGKPEEDADEGPGGANP